MPATLQTYLGPFARWPNRSNACIWIISICILIGLTIKDSLPILNEYIENNRATQIEITAPDHDYHPPPITFCIALRTVALDKLISEYRDALRSTSGTSRFCVECRKLIDHFEWDIFEKIPRTNQSIGQNRSTDQHQDQENLNMTIARSLVSELLAKNQSLDTLDPQNFHWNQALLDSVSIFFFCLIEFEKNLLTLNKSDERPFCRLSNELADRFLHDTYQIDQLYQKMLNIFCLYLSFTTYDAKDAKFDCLSDLPRIRTQLLNLNFGGNAFCCLLPMTRNKLAKVSVESRENVGNLLAFNGSSSYFLLAHTRQVDWPLQIEESDNSYWFASDRPNQSIELTQRVIFTVTEEQDKFRRVCYNETTTVECVGHCVLRRFVERCRCIPFAFRHFMAPIKNSTTKYCQSGDYSKCEWNLALKTRLESECEENECRVPCVFVSYFWFTRSWALENDSSLFSAYILPGPYVYINFKITTKNSVEQLLSQLAAFFNFYLGASGLTIIAGIIFCKDNFERYREWKKKREEKEETKEPRSMNVELEKSASRNFGEEEGKFREDFEQFKREMEKRFEERMLEKCGKF